MPWSRRTSNTPAELRLLPTQRPVREGIYADSPGVRKDSGATKTRSQRENRATACTRLGRPTRRCAEGEKGNDRTPAGSSTLPAYRCLERRLYPCGASTYFGWRSVQGGSYGTRPSPCKSPSSQKSARSGKSRGGAFAAHLHAILGGPGVVSERLKERDWKSRGRGQPVSRVRIPPTPFPAARGRASRH